MADASGDKDAPGDKDTESAPLIRSTGPDFFGRKTIGVFGATAYVINNVVGAGSLALPAMFQTYGARQAMCPSVVFITCS